MRLKMRTDSLAMLSNGWNHLRGRNIPARQPFDSDVQTEMISQITLFCGEPVASAHQNLTVSCLMRRTFFESLHQQVVLGSEEARKVALTLASVRLSNCTYGFPVCSFRKDFITAEMPKKESA